MPSARRDDTDEEVIMDDVRTRPRGNAERATSAFTGLAQEIRTRGLLRRRYGY